MPDAARYLALMFGEEVNEADVLRFALDGHLRLSVRFVNGAEAVRYVPVSPESVAEIHEFFESVEEARGKGLPPPQPRVRPVPTPEEIAQARVFRVGNDPFDLPLVGGERITVEDRYQALTGGPRLEVSDVMGSFFDGSDGKRYQLQARLGEGHCVPGSDYYDPSNFFPPGELPRDSVLVVRTSALRDFEARFGQNESADPAPERPLRQRERSTLLVLIGALARAARIDITRPSKAAGAIEALTQELGARVSARAIEDHLRLVPDAIERASK